MRPHRQRGMDADRVFEDVLFGTTGVLLLVMTTALAQISTPGVRLEKLDDLREQVARAEANAASAAQEARDAEERRAQERAAREDAENALSEVKSELEPKPVDVVICADGTVSMENVLEALRVSVKSIAEIGSRVSSPARFRLGVVVFRSATGSHAFELHEIQPSVEGVPSPGMRALRAFADKEDIVTRVVTVAPGSEEGKPTGKKGTSSRMGGLVGYADVGHGLSAALDLFGVDAANDRRALLCFVGDVGPWEAGDPQMLEANDRAIAAQLRQAVEEFAAREERGRVLALFTGKQSTDLRFGSESEAFFRSLAAAAGEKGRYSDDITDLTASVLEAIFSKE